MDGMDSIDIRAKLGDRTYEAGVRLLNKGGVERIEQLSPTAYYARVRDSGTKIVLFRDRDGTFDATCDCTDRPMGCRHCAAVYLRHRGFEGPCDVSRIRMHIAGFANMSLDPLDYDMDGGMTPSQVDNYLQDKIIDRKLKSIGRTIIEVVPEGRERTGLLRELWGACGMLEYPHDEWSRESMESMFDVDFEGDNRSSGKRRSRMSGDDHRRMRLRDGSLPCENLLLSRSVRTRSVPGIEMRPHPTRDFPIQMPWNRHLVWCSGSLDTYMPSFL